MEHRKKQKVSGSVIDRDMVISGDVTFQGQMVINGTIEGTLTGDKVVLGSEGVLDGEVQLQELDCNGIARGMIGADRVRVNRTAEVVGTIAARELDMSPGAVFVGDMKIGGHSGKKVEVNRRKIPAVPEQQKRPEDDPPVVQVERAATSEEGSVLDGLTAALVGGSSLVMVISDDEDGRRALCKELQKGLAESFNQLCIHEPTGSFREILRRISKGFEIELTDYSDQDVMIRDLTSAMSGSGRYLLIVENVEKMYPATLERVVRYLVGEEGRDEIMTKMVLFGNGELQKMMGLEESNFFVRDPDCIFEL